MFAVIYQFKLRPHQEIAFKECWDIVTDYFIAHCGAIGSCLHQGNDGLWMAYSRWPDKATRDAAWPGDEEPNTNLPDDICNAIKTMQLLKGENIDLEQYDEICSEVVTDKLNCFNTTE